MEPGNLGIWDQEMKTLKIKICVAQNVGKVWASFEAIVSEPKNAQTKAFLLIFLSWPRGPTPISSAERHLLAKPASTCSHNPWLMGSLNCGCEEKEI